MKLIKRDSPDQADSSTRRMLQDIADSFQACQRHTRPPERFKVSIPEENIVFNQEVALDLMWLDGKALLHIVDTQTHFMSAAFLKGQTVEDVWETFVLCWATQYTGFTMRIHTDQGSAFTSLRWTRRCDAVGTESKLSGVDSHNSLGSGERYHEPLRRVYRKIREVYPKMKKETTLRLAIKAYNDTLGPEGLVPSLLVFGCLPRFPSVDSSIPAQSDRMTALREARSEMETIVSQLRIRRAILAKVPRCSDFVLEPGDMVRVFRESDKSYIQPYPVLRVDGKQVYILDGRREVQFSLHQVIPVRTFDALTHGDHYMDELYAATRQFCSQKPRKKNQIPPVDVHIVDILHPGDPRANSTAAQAAKKNRSTT